MNTISRILSWAIPSTHTQKKNPIRPKSEKKVSEIGKKHLKSDHVSWHEYLREKQDRK